MGKNILCILIFILLSSTLIVTNAETSLPLSSFFMHSQNAIPPSGGMNEVIADDGVYAISYTDDQHCNGSSDSCDCCLLANGKGCCICSEGRQWTWHKFVFEIPEGKDISNATFKWNGKSTFPIVVEYYYASHMAEDINSSDPLDGTFPIGYILNLSGPESTFTYVLTENDRNILNQNRKAIFYVDNDDCSTGHWALQSDYVELMVTLIDTPSYGITSSIVATPFEVYNGDKINVSMTVQNVGNTVLPNVTPSQLYIVGDGEATTFTGPEPQSVNIDPNSQITFVWKYTATKSGKVAFRGNATSEGLVSSDETTSNEVLIKNTELDDKKEKLEIVDKVVKARLNHLSKLIAEIESKIGPNPSEELLQKLNMANALIEEAKNAKSPSKANKLLNEAREILNEIIKSLR